MITPHLCVIHDCGRIVHGYGWCRRHYRAWKLYGDPFFLLRPTRRMTPEERFWHYVTTTTDLTSCWLWTAGVNKDGYGQTSRGRHTISAHHVAWELAHGPIPQGLCVLHTCDVRACVRNDGIHSHLFLGTNEENTLDRHRKGRDAQGTRSGMHTHPEKRSLGQHNGNAKYSDTDIADIRTRFLAGQSTQAVLAHEYGMHYQYVWNICHGKVRK